MIQLEHLPYIEAIRTARTLTYRGTVQNIIGLLIESSGPRAKVGEICRLIPDNGIPILGEVVGFRGSRVLLMPFGDATGISPGALVIATGRD